MTTPPEVTELRQLIDDITPHTDNLSPRSRDFVYEMSERLNEFGDLAYVSSVQLAWMRNLVAAVDKREE